MGYQVTAADDGGYIDPEFDHLLWCLDREGIAPVKERCQAIINSANSAHEQVQWAHALLGLTALAEGRCEDALAYAQLAIQAPYPINTKALSTYYIAMCKLGNCSQALQGLEGVVRQYPTSADALYALGICYQESNDLSNAWKAFIDAYTNRPSWKYPLLSIIELGEQASAHEQVASLLEEAVKHIPWELDVRCALATCYVRLGDIERGLAEARRFLAFSHFAPVSPPILERFRAAFNGSQATVMGA